MIEAICKETDLVNNFISGETIETIYIGGGTPSLLSVKDIASIFDRLYQKFSIEKKAEITLEANPDDINTDVLAEWKQLGINRLSVGLQTFNDAELKWMNRAHDAAQSLQCLEDISHSGFSSYSVDLIYGSPLQTDGELQKNFRIIAENKVPHISCYALTAEPRTALMKLLQQDKNMMPDPDKQATQFYLLLEMMKDNGYLQYETSNFSKPGHESRHNSSYWQGRPYYGFGPSAHSFDGLRKRRWNISDNTAYIASIEKNVIPYEEEILTDDQRLNEYIMTALRTSDGINLDVVQDKFGEISVSRILKDAAKYFQNGKLIRAGSLLILTKEAKYFADGIAADLFQLTSKHQAGNPTLL